MIHGIIKVAPQTLKKFENWGGDGIWRGRNASLDVTTDAQPKHIGESACGTVSILPQTCADGDAHQSFQ